MESDKPIGQASFYSVRDVTVGSKFFSLPRRIVVFLSSNKSEKSNFKQFLS